MKRNMKIIIIVGIFLLIVWFSLFWFMVKYASELRVHPCSICARRMGEDVFCTTTGKTRTYFPNGSYEETILRKPIEKIYLNYSLINISK